MAAITGALVAGSASRACADEAEGPFAPDRYWYGWQNALVDAAELSLVFVGAARGQPALGWVGGVSSVFGSSLIHAAHGNFELAMGAAGARASFVGVGLLVGALFGPCDPNENDYASSRCHDRNLLVSYSVSMGLAALADDVFVARARRTGVWPALLPFGSTVPPVHGGLSGYTFGVGGVF